MQRILGIGLKAPYYIPYPYSLIPYFLIFALVKKHKVIGLMSGTSLDGLDIACCEFTLRGSGWHYRILAAETIAYDKQTRKRLSGLDKAGALELTQSHAWFGHFSGAETRKFIRRHKLNPRLVVSHGHTVFHQPRQGFTLQIGNGAALAAEAGLPVVCDLRSLDVALGGQGAPLVPIGDRLLFSGYDACLNLGGFANISYEQRGRRIAFDICPVNLVLNFLSAKRGRPFDRDGALAAKGSVDLDLLRKLEALPFYSQRPPKSLGKEWVDQAIMPLLDRSSSSIEDQLRTFSEHIALRIAAAIDSRFGRPARVLATGGGVYNGLLIALAREKCKAALVIPDRLTIEFKEALIFAFLGLLRWRGEINTLRSVTGARCDSTGGAIYLPGK